MPSFDIVSQVDLQEVRNAVDQAARELSQRYDFRGTDSSVSHTEESITVESDSEGRLDAANDVLKSKLVRRGIDLRSIGGGEPQQVGGGRSRSEWILNQGISKDAAKDLTKQIRDLGLKVTRPGEEARRPPAGDHGHEGPRLRAPAAVPQLPGLTTPRSDL
jgi:uncharacterized protein YajQ (UPF0234 family)